MTKNELTNVVGGFSWGFWTAVGAGISFVIGFFEGIVNPIKCGK